MCNWRWRDSRRDSSPAGRRKQPALLVTAPQQKLNRFRHRILHPVRIHRNVHLRQLRPGVVAAINWPDAARICLFRFPAVDCDDATGRPRRSSLGDSTDPLEFFGIGWNWLAALIAQSRRGPVGHGVGRRRHIFRPGNGNRLRQSRCYRGSRIRKRYLSGVLFRRRSGRHCNPWPIFDRIGWPACVGGIMLSSGAAAVFALRLRMTPEERSPLIMIGRYLR